MTRTAQNKNITLFYSWPFLQRSAVWVSTARSAGFSIWLYFQKHRQIFSPPTPHTCQNLQWSLGISKCKSNVLYHPCSCFPHSALFILVPGVILIKAGRGSEHFPNLTTSSSFSGPCGPEKDLHVHEKLLNLRITDPGFNPGRALSREETQEL